MFSAKNKFFKYKLLAFLLLLLILTDALIHKGMVRVMLPKTFLYSSPSSQTTPTPIPLINRNKNWMKAINTPKKMEQVNANTSGIEMDIYFDSATKTFSVHHDLESVENYAFEELLHVYHNRGLNASIWIDFKNLSANNQQDALITLVRLRDKYQLKNKILVESSYPELLTAFTVKQFYISYYTPYFNPYLLGKDSLEIIAEQIKNHLDSSRVQAISGYYFQFPFLHERFPNYPILIWGSNDKFSLVNLIYRNFIKNKKEIIIKLNP